MRDTIRKSKNRWLARKGPKHDNPANERMQAERLKAAEALRDNRCPTCGGPVRQNNAMTGWVQCAQFGARQFRFCPDRPECTWQGFTV